MRVEHVAFNVSAPADICRWYCDNLEMRIVRCLDDQAQTHFLVDSGGQMMVEMYCNPVNAVPDYTNMNPLILHLAFVSSDPQLDRIRLEEAGAVLVEDLHLADGSNLVMMKDPWGFSLQLCRRGS